MRLAFAFAVSFPLLVFMTLSVFAQEKPIAIDGDTLAVGSERVRVLGLDAPETYSSQCDAEARLGYAAAGRLQHLINSRRVRIERTGKTDKYRRALARVWVGDDDVASILIAEGLARPYTGGKRQPWCPAGQPREAAY